MVSPTLSNTAATRAFSIPLRLVPITTSPTRPPWDYNAASDTRLVTDTSAAAIASAGLLRLCRHITDPIKGHFYWSTAIHILRSLCATHLGDTDANWEGILRGGVYHLNKAVGVDESVMWGEYYFVEALEEALRLVG